MNVASSERRIVISAAASLLPQPQFLRLRQGSPLARAMDTIISGMAGAEPTLALIDAENFASRWPLRKRSGSQWLCHVVARSLEDAALSNPKRRPVTVSAVNCLPYLYISGEMKANPFSFKQNLEHQTPSFLGDEFDLTGAQFTLREGDNCGLVAIEALIHRLGEAEATLICGVSSPHPLLKRIEISTELRAAEAAFPGVSKGSNLRFSEGAAALVIERIETASARKVRPLAEIVGWYHALHLLDYTDTARIETSLRRSMRKLKALTERPVRFVYACFRRNTLLASIEQKVLVSEFPEAEIVSTVNSRGDCSPIDGLIDIEDACRNRLDSTGDVVVQKISSCGHYAGVILREVQP